MVMIKTKDESNNELLDNIRASDNGACLKEFINRKVLQAKREERELWKGRVQRLKDKVNDIQNFIGSRKKFIFYIDECLGSEK